MSGTGRSSSDPSPPASSSDDIEQLLAERTVDSMIRGTLTSPVAIAVMFGALLHVDSAGVIRWSIVRIAMTVALLVFLRRVRHEIPADPTGSMRRVEVAEVVNSAGWAMVAAFVFVDEDRWLGLVAILIFGRLAVAIPTATASPRMFVTSTVATVVVASVSVARYGTSYAYVMIAIFVVAALYSTSLFLASHRVTVTSVESEIENRRLVVALQTERVRLTIENRELEQRSGLDDLTELAGRTQFETFLDELAADEPHEPVAVAYIDIDHFKAINDSLGHGAGDGVLVQSARRWSNLMGVGDLLARTGGDEFVAIFRNVPSTAVALDLGERIRGALHDPITGPGDPISVTCSVGVATGSARAGRQRLVEAADQALYEAKRKGRDAVHVAPAASS